MVGEKEFLRVEPWDNDAAAQKAFSSVATTVVCLEKSKAPTVDMTVAS
jgi:hypothetical protein